MKDTDSFHILNDQLHIGYWQETERSRELPWDHAYRHYTTFDKVFEILTQELGFVEPKRPFKELVWADRCRFKTLKKDHKCAGNKYLRVDMHRAPDCIIMEFYYKDSRTGRADNLGNYDFNKWGNAKNLERKTFIKISKRLSEYFKLLGAVDDTKPEFKGRAYVMWSINEDPGRHWGKWEDYKDEGYFAYNNKDRDEKVIFNGEVKYFRDYSGRLSRGQTYHSINNMWYVVTSDDTFSQRAGFELFDAVPEDFKNRRVIKDRIPEAGKIRQRIGTKLYKELVSKGLSLKLAEASK